MTLEVSATIGGRRTETITFTPEQLEIVAQAGAALRRHADPDPATGEIKKPVTRGATPAADPADARGQLPEALLDSFRQFYGGLGDKHQWGIGRVVDDALIEFAGKYSANKILKAAAKEMDVSRAEVLKCQVTWRATDPQLRDDFDMLRFEHFAVVARLLDDRDAMAQWLGLAVDSAADYGGRFMPAKKLEAKLKEHLGLTPPEPTFAELFDRAVTAVTTLRDHADTETRSVKVAAVLAALEKVN